MILEEELYPVGKFQKTHALKGELNMISEIDIDYFLEGHPLIVNNDGIFVPYYADTIRKKGNTSYLIKIDGIESETLASNLVNKEIYILKKDAEELIDKDVFLSGGLISYKIIDDSNDKTIGVIDFIDDSTVNELFIVKDEQGNELMLPANEDFIKEINEEEKIIRMILPEGLMTINSKAD